MSKRLFTLMSVALMLAVFSVAQAQQPTVSGERGYLLTEAQINAEFRIPSTATRQISNLEVDVQEDGVHVSFQMTVTRNGRSETLNIIAILIGLFDQPRVSSMELENTLISNYAVSPSLRREVTSLVLNSWNDYEARTLELIPADQMPANGIIMRDGGICNPRTMLC